MGPFKLEYQSKNPEVSIVHDFASPKELHAIKNLARGHMKSTPYISGAEEESYSKERTSKVIYMNEKLVPAAMRLSTKVEQVTRYKMKDEKYGSENFQVMNYGIGGRISTHLDSVGMS